MPTQNTELPAHATISNDQLHAIIGGRGTPAERHTVESGDNLTKIARDNNLSLDALLELNPQYRKNPDLIHPGQSVTTRPANPRIE